MLFLTTGSLSLKFEKCQGRELFSVGFFFPLEENTTSSKYAWMHGIGWGLSDFSLSCPPPCQLQKLGKDFPGRDSLCSPFAMSTAAGSLLRADLQISPAPSSFWLSESSLEPLIRYCLLSTGFHTGIDLFSYVPLYCHFSRVWKGWGRK